MKRNVQNVASAAALVFVCLATLLASTAAGQSMSISVASPESSFKPEINSRDMNIISRVLGLSETEREAVRTLHDGYAAALKIKLDTVLESTQERTEKAQALGDWHIAQPSDQETAAWEHDSKQLHDAFFADLKSLLSKEQADRWPLVERELRRLKKFPGGRLAGESVDVIHVVDDLVPQAWSIPGVADALSSYALRIDALLQRRGEVASPERAAAFETASKSDKAEAEKMWRSALDSRVAIRDLNMSVAEEVAAQLPAPDRERVKRKIFELCYPSLMQHSRTESFLRAAASLDSLTPSQSESMRATIETYDQDLATLLKDMAAVIRNKQLQQKPIQLEPGSSKRATTDTGEVVTFFSSADMKSDPSDPMTALRLKRFELDVATKRKVRAILSDAQVQACNQPTIDQISFGEDTFWGL
jgi:hypothetical protein